MAKLIALYKTPENPTDFDDKYFNTHIPLVEKVPGLEKITLTRFSRTLAGDGLYLMAEMTFADADARKAAMRSHEMGAAGENLESFATGLYTLMYGEELES